MKGMRTFLISVVTAAALGASSLHEGRASAQQASFRSSSSELVVLPVTVMDKEGGFVADLPAERFVVLDNGRRQAVSLFTNEDIPVTMGIVIDNSGSMRSKLGLVIAATIALAKSSNPDDEIFTLEFNDRVRDPFPRNKTLRAGDLGALEAGLRSFNPEGRTALYDALMSALDRLDGASGARKVVVVMSDGADNASAATLDGVLARAHRSNAAFYTIGLFDRDDPDKNPGVLKSLAQATGGERFLPASPGYLLQACERIAREIRSAYTIGYVPPDRDGAYHKIQVQIEPREARRLVARTRPGYFAASEARTQ